MMIRSEKMIYDGERYTEPACVLDTALSKVTVIDPTTLESKTTQFHTESVQEHLGYVASHHPERLQKLVDEGRIIEYLDDLETRAREAVDRQVEKWLKSDKEYQAALMAGDDVKAVGLKNGLQIIAMDMIRETIINV